MIKITGNEVTVTTDPDANETEEQVLFDALVRLTERYMEVTSELAVHVCQSVEECIDAKTVAPV